MNTSSLSTRLHFPCLFLAALCATALPSMAAGYPSHISNLVVNSGAVLFGSAPTLTGKLDLSSENATFLVEGLPDQNGWGVLATAAEIAGPANQTEWTAGRTMYRIVTSNDVSKLECATDAATVLLFR